MKWHVRCLHPRCGFHVRAVGELAKDAAKQGHEDATGHDVAAASERALEFRSGHQVGDGDLDVARDEVEG